MPSTDTVLNIDTLLRIDTVVLINIDTVVSTDTFLSIDAVLNIESLGVVGRSDGHDSSAERCAMRGDTGLDRFACRTDSERDRRP